MASLANQPPKKAICNPGDPTHPHGNHNSSGQTVKFARRTSSGWYVSLSRDDQDMSGEISRDYLNYTLHLPPALDNLPMDLFVAVKVEEQYLIELEVCHPQMNEAKGSACSMPTCDGKLMKDDRGADVILCDCRFKICRDCYMDARKENGLCPSCKEPYKVKDYEDGTLHFLGRPSPFPAGSALDGSKRDDNNMVMTKRNQIGGFDHNQWLFETKDTYGVGNAFWPYDDTHEDDGDHEGFKEGTESMDKPWEPLTRKLPISAGIICSYRFFIFVRFMELFLFLQWRIAHPNDDAVWLWLMSVVCEIWFAFSWILDQIPKLCPLNRSTDLQILHDKFEMPSPSNIIGISDLPGVDLFVSTADPEKEPPLVTSNTILSILSVDYPVEKLACYLSDDGGSLLTFEAMAEVVSFANLWVPFCRKHDIEPRNPESYSSLKVDPTKNKSTPHFVKDRRKMKREYDEFKLRINGLSDSIRRRSDAFNAREEMKMLKHMRESGANPFEHSKGDHAGILQVMLKPPNNDHRGQAMNALVRTSAFLSNGPFILNLDCDHYIYNCKAIREGMCFVMEEGGENICYIQFPQRFEGFDPSDRYANHNTVFFDGNMRALDGVQGPFYVGTGCMFRRFALYGFDPPQLDKISQKTESEAEALRPTNFYLELHINMNLLPKHFGNSTMLAESIPLAEYQGRPLADHPAVKYGRPPGALRVPRDPLDAAMIAESVSVISCWYEDKTEWGDRVGWIYVYCITKRDAFRGSAPINLTDRLHQVLRWATGSVEIFFSRNNALLGSRRLKFLQRIAYLNVGIYPFTSVFLISLFSNTGVGLEEWWRNEQFWLISGTSSHLAAVVQGLLKVIAGIEISFTLTSKSALEENDDIFQDLYLVKWTSLMIPPIVIAMLNIVGIAVAFSRTICSMTPQWSTFVGEIIFWVLAHLYPFAKGLMGRRGKTPTIVFVWSGLIAITLSLLWIAMHQPTKGKLNGKH
ncbi:hypothetical protein I3843_05G086800 [Carya illinoinensis]|nr:hypothetical protein I3843_05G086800 [Carya illinoinensis]